MGPCFSKGKHLTAEQAQALAILNSSIYSSKHGSKTGGVEGIPGPPPIPDFGLDNNYEVIRLLGEGGSGQTWLCRDLETDENLAIKLIRRPIPRVLLPMILHEIQIQARLGSGHCNLVNSQHVVLTPGYLGIVMEFVAGGNLTTYVSSRWSSTSERGGLFLSEGEARYFFQQFLFAVEYLHSHHVAHRDLKLDNIVLDDQVPPRIKLCDFGFAKNWDEDSNMQTQIGTPVYMSPQLINMKQNQGKGYDATKADVWACGVLLFVMLLGMFPFEHTDHPDPNSSAAHVEVWLQQIKTSWRENSRVAEHAQRLSADCTDLLDKIFDLDESQRITIPVIRQHPWFTAPLEPQFAASLRVLAEQQAQVEVEVRCGAFESNVRDVALEALVKSAGQAHVEGVDRAYRRVTVSQLQKHYSVVKRKSLHLVFPEETIIEE
ncbi:MAG: hypothetical protein WDW38_000382 [Sanguina aurantia]